MKYIKIFLIICFAILSINLPIFAGGALKVIKAGPTGDLRSISEANEVRIIFSESVVAIGKAEDNVSAPFFHISPNVEGKFRWSGSNILIFTPSKPFQYSMKYAVTVDKDIKPTGGNILKKAYSFDFTTPRVELLNAYWKRKGDNCKNPIQIFLTFNQPVNPDTVIKNLSLNGMRHDWYQPKINLTLMTMLSEIDKNAVSDFNLKISKTLTSVKDESKMEFQRAKEWNKKDFPESPNLVVAETKLSPVPGAWIELSLPKSLRGIEGNLASGKEIKKTLNMEEPFFVDGMKCSKQCNPDLMNYIKLYEKTTLRSLSKSIKIMDVSDKGKRKIVVPEEHNESYFDETEYEFSIDDLGYHLKPGRIYAVVIDKSLKSFHGEELGYTWIGMIENWHRSYFISWGTGHGVWEKDSGTKVPFKSRNYKSVSEWLYNVPADKLMSLISDFNNNGFNTAPPVNPTDASLHPAYDKTSYYGFDIKDALSSSGTGIIWASVFGREPLPKTSKYGSESDTPESTLLQVTDLGISVKDSPQDTLIFVTKLSNGIPVEGAEVEIINKENMILWKGVTGKDGIAIAPAISLRPEDTYGDFRFLVLAKKDNDTAYVLSDWNYGVEPWSFDLNYDLKEAEPLLRGSVFTDRGVYKLGEEVHLKAIIRKDTPKGVIVPPKDTKIIVKITDNNNKEIDTRSLPLSEWGTADWTFTIPKDGSLGEYSISTSIDGSKEPIDSSFLIAAYRRPDFRVDVSLSTENPTAGSTLKGIISGRYLFGGVMNEKPAAWTFKRERIYEVPKAITDIFPYENYAFLNEWNYEERDQEQRGEVKSGKDKLDSKGELILDLPTDIKAGYPYKYTLEGRVKDISRQEISGRAGVTIHPAPWYIGIKKTDLFSETDKPVQTGVVAVTPEGKIVQGVKVHLELFQIQWNSIRKEYEDGFYGWESEKKEVKQGEWDIATRDGREPDLTNLDIKSGGEYLIRARAEDEEGRSTFSEYYFYALGSGYTAWERYDNNRIDLIPEKKTYKPGDTANIMIKSPWEKATALLTTEREGIKSYRVFTLTSTQQTVSVPITEDDIPNLFVSVLLIQGRTSKDTLRNENDPGKPSFKLGYIELFVEDSGKRLTVSVISDKKEYRPAEKAAVTVSVKDSSGHPAEGEVTLWAVDYGVLSLTSYKTPDIIHSVFISKALQVMNEDSRMMIVSRRVLEPKGEDAEATGGGGLAEGPGSLRRDFRVLAFWLGTAVTDSSGILKKTFTLPESLTTYRIMAVVNTKGSRFGAGEKEVQINKPLLLTPAFPRFMALRDKAIFGAVIHNQLKDGGSAIVTMRSLSPDTLEIKGEGKRVIEIKGGGTEEVRFQVEAKKIGKASIQMTVTLHGERDGFEESLPVIFQNPLETSASYGETENESVEAIDPPENVLPSPGGIDVEVSSTALVGLSEAAEYLIDYPYGCAEQKSSGCLAIMLTSDLAGAFNIRNINQAELKTIAQNTINELPGFQKGDGGFAYWRDSIFSSQYLTAFVLHVMQAADKLGYKTDKKVMENAYGYLEQQLKTVASRDEDYWLYENGWKAFAVKVLCEGGKHEDSLISSLYDKKNNLPIFALCYLWDAISKSGEGGKRGEELHRMILNSILPEAGGAHVEEFDNQWLSWIWSSSVKSTSIAISTLVRHGEDKEFLFRMVRWLMQMRKKGRWGNTQDNSHAMEALIDYYKIHEKSAPDFAFTILSGEAEWLKGRFSGRTTEAWKASMTMEELKSKSVKPVKFKFKKDGTGTLYYSARLTYIPAEFELGSLDKGFQISRTYTPLKGGKESNTYNAGDLVKITIRVHLTKSHSFIAITDPIPAGFEVVESWFATSSADLLEQQNKMNEDSNNSWWGDGFDHVERHDNKVLLFATHLSDGDHSYSYIARATTSGTFYVAPAHAEEMYMPDVSGRTSSVVIDVKE